jgi:hypothetical protein
LPVVLADAEVHLSDGAFNLLLIVLPIYALVTLWAVVDTARRSRPAWTVAVVLLGPVGVGAWIVRRVRDAGSDRGSDIRRPVGL